MLPLNVKDTVALWSYDHCMETMGQRIKILRLAKGLTQDELADICGVSRNAVSQWENDTTADIKLQPFLALYEALGTSPQFLVFGDDKGRGSGGKIRT